jgi:ribonuclease J
LAIGLFAGQKELPRARQKTIRHGKPQRIGDFLVTAYSVDHSSYGSMALLIEAQGNRSFIRAIYVLHGRKPGMEVGLLKAIGKAPLDLLIMEGTSLSRGKEPALGPVST